MRIRIQTVPPLPDLKAWFVPRPTGKILAVKTISELKKVICHDIKQLSQEGHNFKAIQLLLEGFELLDDLPYEELLRDGDLIFIQASQEVSLKPDEARKRKRRDTLDGDPTRKRQKSLSTKYRNNLKKAARDAPIMSTSSDSSSESASSSTSTTSESDDESENSDSDSTTSSSDAISESSNDSRRSRLLPETVPEFKSSKASVVSPVPPGYGKSSTQSRNRRRRLKRQHEREAKEAQHAPPHGISDANLTPLGTTSFEKPVEPIPGTAAEPGAKTATELSQVQSASSQRDVSSPATLDNSNGDIMMISLRNKNKKKNFRQTMATPATRKIIFDDNGTAQSVGDSTRVFDTTSSVSPPLHVERAEMDQTDKSADAPTSLPSRVLPPSELAAAGLLPSNMFVTSVEFGRQPKKKKQKARATHEQQVSHELRVSRAYEDEDEARGEGAGVDLPYGNEEESGSKSDEIQPQFDWRAAKANWDRFPPITSISHLCSGVLVCWQGLAINPQTFTPEHLLGVGRVEQVAGETFTIRQLLRPGTETAAAFGIGQENGGEGEEEHYSWNDILGLGWRIVELD